MTNIRVENDKNNKILGGNKMINLTVLNMDVQRINMVLGTSFTENEIEMIKLAKGHFEEETLELIERIKTSTEKNIKDEAIQELMAFSSATKATLNLIEKHKQYLVANNNKLELAIKNNTDILVIANYKRYNIESNLKASFIAKLKDNKLSDFNPEFKDMYLTKTNYNKELDKLIVYLKIDEDITGKSKLQSLKKVALNKTEYRSVLSILIQKDTAVYTTVSMPENAGTARGYFTALQEVNAPINMTMSNGTMKGSSKRINIKDFASFTDTLISVTVDSTEVANELLNTKLYVNLDGLDTEVYKECQNSFTELLTGKQVQSINGEKYIAFGYSPSKLRQLTCYYIKASLGEEYIDNMINDLTSGGYNIIKGNSVNLKGGAKAITRLFSWLAPSVPFYQLKCYAFYNGKWTDNRSNSVDKGEALGDGMAFIGQIAMTKGYKKALGLSIDSKTVFNQVQCRPFFTNKCSAQVMNEHVLYKFICNHFEVIRFTYDEITSNVQSELEKGTKGIYGNKVVIICETKEDLPEFFTDRNVLKIDHDYSRRGDVNVLDIAQVSNANTSIQMLQKGLYKDVPACENFIMKRFIETIVKQMNNQLDDKKPSVPAYTEITEKIWISEIIQKIMPEYALSKEKSVLTSNINNLTRGIIRRINRMNFNLDGSNLRLLPDISFMVGTNNLIKIGEVYSKDASRYKNNKIKEIEEQLKNDPDNKDLKELLNYFKNEFKVSIFKYPSIGVKEYILGTPIDYKTIEKRINALSIPEDDKDFLKSYYKSVTEATIIIPAYSFVMKQLAGLDFDFDGCTTIYDKDFVEILEKNYELYVVSIEKDAKQQTNTNKNDINNTVLNRRIKKSNTNEEMFKIGQDLFNNIFVKQISNGNLSVGVITKLHDNILAAQRSDKYIYFLNIIFKSYESKTVKEYIGLSKTTEKINNKEIKIVHVSPNKAEKAIKEMRKSVLTAKNAIKIYEDLDAIFRMYQELTIDSAKTGEIVPINTDLIFKWKSLIDKSADLSIDFEELNINTHMPTIEDKEIKGDILVSLRNKMIKEIITLFKGEGGLFESVKEVGFIDEELSLLQTESRTVNSELNYLYEIKKIYNTITATYANDLKSSNEEEENRMASTLYKERCEILSSMIRHQFNEKTPEEIGKLVKLAALNSKSGIVNSTNSFALKICKEEYLTYLISEGYAEVEVCGSEVISNNGKYEEGDYVDFNKGVGTHIIARDAISGIFKITSIDGRLYAVKNIVDEIIIPEENNKIMVQVGYSFFKQSISEQNEALNKINSAKIIELKQEKRNVVIYADNEPICYIEARKNEFKENIVSKATVSEIIKTPIKFNDKEGTSIVLILDNVEYKENKTEIEEFNFNIDASSLIVEAEAAFDLDLEIEEESIEIQKEDYINTKKEAKEISNEIEVDLNLSFFA